MTDVTLTITTDTATATSIIALLNGSTISQPEPSVKNAEKPGKSTKDKTPEAAPTPAEDTQEPVSTVTYPDYDTEVKPLILQIGKGAAPLGREAVGALMKKFSVEKGPDLKPEQYADFITAANEVIDGAMA